MRYIDSSAYAKYYSTEENEKGADKIKELFEKARRGEETLFTSILLLGEVVSIFDKWHRKHLITKEDLDELLTLFVRHLRELTEVGGLILEPLTPLVFVPSIRYITQYHISVGDAIHLYTALMYLPRNEEFVCSDKNLNTAAKAEGFIINDPENS